MKTMVGDMEQVEGYASGPARRAVILVVDDEPMVREVVRRYLAREGYLVREAGDGAAALQQAGEVMPDLIVLDLMLPAVDGLEVCRHLRERSPAPIIILTARGDEADKILGFGLGADDYLVKPFSPRELVARVQAVLRRTWTQAATAEPPLVFANLTIDPTSHRAEVRGQPVDLTPTEFNLLAFLASHAGRVFTRQQLLDHVWERDVGDASTVTVHMRRLREKVEPDPVTPRHLKTVWGVGYLFEP
jgi:DNA-binding response OmpR family regulator